METENKKLILYAPIMKTEKADDYLCVLSDTSIDRDGEIVSKEFMELAASDTYMPALIDHENKALNLIAEWVDKRVVEVEPGRYAFTAKPKFYLSNPNARIIKDMMDKDGAKFGLSITAIPYTHDYAEFDGKKVKRWISGEIVSTDFVGIPAQKYAMAAKIAKKLNIDKSYDMMDWMNDYAEQKYGKEYDELTAAEQASVKQKYREVHEKSLEIGKNWTCPECGKATKKSLEEETMSEETIKELKEMLTEINKSIMSLKKAEEPVPEPEPIPVPAPEAIAMEKKVEPEKAREETLKELNKSLPTAETSATTEIKSDVEGFIQITKNRRRN